MEQIDIVKLDTQPAQTSIKELRKALKAYKDEMAGLEEGSSEFLNVAAKAGAVKHQIDEINQSVAGASADFGDMLASGTKTIQGIMGGFQAAQGALTLFGVESEEVTKAIQKMQASMAVIQGLDAIDNGIKGFKKFTTAIKSSTKGLSGFKKALIGTGIGAIVILIGELIAHFDELDKLTGGKLTKTLDGLKGVLGNLGGELKAIGNLVLTSLVAPFKSYLELLKGVGKVIKSVFEGDFKSIGGIVDETKTAMIEPFKDVKDEAKNVGSEFQKGFDEGVTEARVKATEKAKEELQKQIEEYRKAANEKLDIEKARAEATIHNEDDLKKKLLEIEKQRLSLYTQGTKEYWEQVKKINELEATEAEEIKWDATLKAEKINHQIQLAELEKQYNDGLINQEQYLERKKELDDTYTQDYIDSLQFILENEKLTDEERLQVLKEYNDAKRVIETPQKVELDKNNTNSDDTDGVDKYDVMSKQIGELNDTLTTLGTNDAFGKLLVGSQKFVSELGKAKTSFDELKKKQAEGGASWKDYEAAASATLGAIGAGLNALGGMLSSLASQQDTSTKEGFEQQKKMQIAATTVNMLGGVVSAVSSAFNPANAWMTIIGQSIYAAAMSAMVLGTGIAQIQSIKNQQFEGGGSTSSTPASSAVQATIIPPTDYSSAVQGAEIESQLGDTKVYVTETDIANTTNKVNVQESENRY